MSADIGIIILCSSNSSVIKRILRDEELDFCQLATTKAHVFVSVNNPLATRSMVSLADVADLPFLCFEQGVFSADYFEEEVLKNNHGTKTIRVSDRATLFNLLIGLNGYTISSGIICKDLNPEIVSIPLQSDAYMEIGYIQIGRAQSELQSPDHLVCRLLLEKKKTTKLYVETDWDDKGTSSNGKIRYKE